jgi:hypothetical protein
VGVDQDLLGTPVEATPLGGIQICASSDEKQTKELNVSVTESLCESLRSLEVIQIVKPIGELAEPVLESRAPFWIPAFGLLLENAVLASILKFNNAKLFRALIPQQQVGFEITKEGVFEGYLSSRSNLGEDGSHVSS